MITFINAMVLEHYDYLKSCELEIFLIEAKKEISEGRFIVGVEQHLQRLDVELSNKNSDK